MRTAAIIAVLLLAPTFATGQEPAKQPTIDQLLDRIEQINKQLDDLNKQKKLAVTDLKAAMKAQQDRLNKLFPDEPTVPPVKPPEPPPVDPLKAKLKAAFDSAAGTSDEKKEWAADLAALYRAAAKLADDKDIRSASALKSKLRDASATLIGPDALKDVRLLVAGELSAVLPTAPDAEITDAHRRAASELFKKLADTLDELAK